MKTFLNYLGQLRIYSLVDFVLLLVVIKASPAQFVGVLILHISFLAYLESKHKHDYRKRVPISIAYVLAVVGVFLFRKIEGIYYLIASFFYTRKIRELGFLSPFLRALQNIFIVAGIIGYNRTTYLIGILFFIRNLCGDFRDIEKDEREGLRTIPILLGFTKNIPNIHLYFVLFTSFVWWSMSPFSIGILIVVWIIELASYRLTPR